MIKAIESDVYKITKQSNYNDNVLKITVKDTEESIIVYKAEIKELVELINKAIEIIE